MPECPVHPRRLRVLRRLAATGLAVGLAAPAGMMSALPAQAQTAPVTADGLAEACGVALTADAPREVLLAVTSVPLDVALEPAPAPTAEEAAPGAAPSPSVTPSPTLTPDPTVTPSPLPAVPLPIGPEPLAVPLLPPAGAGTDDAYRVLLTDPATLETLLDVELGLLLCVAVEETPSAPPTIGPMATAGAEAPTAYRSVLPDPLAPAAPTTTTGAAAAAPVAARSTSSGVIAAGSLARLAGLRGTSRPGSPEAGALLTLPDLAPGPATAAAPIPVLAYPPGTTGVVLPAPPDRPLSVLLPLLPAAASPGQGTQTAVLLTETGPRAGIADALPPALLAAVAAAGLLASQLRRRVPLRSR